MEAEVESLRQRVEQLERLVKGEEAGAGAGAGGAGAEGLQPSECGPQGPTLRPIPEYDQVGNLGALFCSCCKSTLTRWKAGSLST